MPRGDDVEDLVIWLLREVDAIYPDCRGNKILELEQRMRQHYGGAKYYLKKNRPIANHGGVPRATFYRWVSRG